jgi:hypothetical protein
MRYTVVRHTVAPLRVTDRPDCVAWGMAKRSKKRARQAARRSEKRAARREAEAEPNPAHRLLQRIRAEARDRHEGEAQRAAELRSAEARRHERRRARGEA